MKEVNVQVSGEIVKQSFNIISLDAAKELTKRKLAFRIKDPINWKYASHVVIGTNGVAFISIFSSILGSQDYITLDDVLKFVKESSTIV